MCIKSTLKPRVGGVRGYPPKIMAIIVALCEYSNAVYRRTHAMLCARMGLSGIPGKSAIGAAYKRIPKDCLDRPNDVLVEPIYRVAGDSIAMSSDRNLAWVSVRAADKKEKKGWIRIHTLMDINTRAILKVVIPKGRLGTHPLWGTCWRVCGRCIRLYLFDRV